MRHDSWHSRPSQNSRPALAGAIVRIWSASTGAAEQQCDPADLHHAGGDRKGQARLRPGLILPGGTQPQEDHRHPHDQEPSDRDRRGRWCCPRGWSGTSQKSQCQDNHADHRHHRRHPKPHHRCRRPRPNGSGRTNPSPGCWVRCRTFRQDVGARRKAASEWDTLLKSFDTAHRPASTSSRPSKEL